MSDAYATSEIAQDYRALGLKDDEYTRITEILGRRPTDAELAMHSVMWSEHACSSPKSGTPNGSRGRTGCVRGRD